MCAKCDILLRQEHWLLPNELDFLNNIHPDFLAFGQSSVDISDRVLIGRPPYSTENHSAHNVFFSVDYVFYEFLQYFDTVGWVF